MVQSRTAWILGAVASLSLLFGPPVAEGADGQTADAGKLVATIAGCQACHNAPGGAAYAGGLVLHTPFGNLAAPNITQDDETGIGTYTFDDFKRVIHQGIRKDGSPLYPAMPYVHYTLMTDDDVAALWAYMQTIPAVSNTVEVNRLPFPFNVRQSLYVWRELYFTDGRFESDTSESDAWNRGAYIIKALAHCGACHTPRDAMGGSIPSRALEGAQIEEWYAPDISNGPNSIIADWSQERLVAFLSGDSHLNHVALGSMREVVDDLSQIPKSDVEAVATYLKAQKPTAPRTAADRKPVPAATKAAWAATYAQNCESCHGANGEGAPGVAASLVGAGGVLAAEPSNVISVMLEGIAPSGDYGVMPSFRDELSNSEIAGVVNHVRSSWGNDAATNATGQMVNWLRNQSQTAPGVAAGAVCPNVATADVPADVRDMLSKMADAETLDDADVTKVAAAFKAAQPDATMTQTVVDLGGTYCRNVAETGADRATVAKRNILFWNALLQQTATQ